MNALGTALTAHSHAEAGHDALMVADAYAIAAWLNEHGEHIDAQALLAQPLLASSQAYRALHENVINGPQPFGQLAIEYEIEMLSVTIGPPMLRNCERVFGPGNRQYTFLAEHVELDAGHTAFNRRQLSEVLAVKPTALPMMIETGTAALDAYGAFMAECMELAEMDLG